MFLESSEVESEGVLAAAKLIAVAARTAPKGKGIDNLVTGIVGDGSEKEQLIEEMERLAEELEAPFFSRDAQNLADCEAVVLLGTKLGALGVPGCGFCGFADCKQQSESETGICAFNAGDLGIAIGSAVSKAADFRIDNRVLFTAGRAAVNLGLLGDEVEIAYGIALNADGKNIFFDRG
ncbi:ferredoxin domain-containing protein [Fuchsiella alkaliacetigena]|uniref:ferredoxin domain-containing protein n=1 Tax=Fuchsiella alkaliacetigena TaxID=957042 RepID=UPI00200A916A|nr:DUF2148 domain-containing protein [Fuchsiella alkaliacetigena]MCK8825409.1 DUF2148 domain-containing protein [Fuchsiella alkaliacetigena]